MVYTTFSTENAEYVLQLGNHILENKHGTKMFEGIDAMVIETGGSSINSRVLNIAEAHPQLNQPVRYCREKAIPLFTGDASGSYNITLREVSGLLPTLLSNIILTTIGFSTIKIPSIAARIFSDNYFFSQDLVMEARNAVFARKIEEYLAPELQQQLGRKPKIGMVFGAGHVGLEYDLKSKRRRDFTLWNWRNLNFRRWSGFDKELLGKVYEARHDGLEWQVTEHETGLFV